MGRRHAGALPAMRLHKQTGRARVCIAGCRYWLGPWGSVEARLRYDEMIAAYVVSGRKSVEAAVVPPALPAEPTADITVGELVLQWLRHVEATRGRKSSTYTAGVVCARMLREVRTLPAREFGPRRLIEARARFAATPVVRRNKRGEVVVEKPRSRRYVNDVVARVVQAFSWAATMEVIPGDKPAALREVKPLRCGENTAVAESEPRQAVDDPRVEAVLQHLRPPLRALVRFIRLTGCRPGEAASLRLVDVQDRDQVVWRYTPRRHKNAWRGHGKHIPVGPEAQAVVVEALGGRGDIAYVFDPRLAVPDRKGSPPTVPMSPRRASSRVGETYAASSIRHAITRACKKAKCEGWYPYLLRYARNQEIRKLHGPEAAAANLGDRSPQMLNRYAPAGWEAAADAAAKTG